MSETWLSDYIHVFNSEILPASYTIYRCDWKTQGGGVLVAVRNSIPLWLASTPADLQSGNSGNPVATSGDSVPCVHSPSAENFYDKI